MNNCIKILLLLVTSLFSISCSSGKKSADDYLVDARKALADGDTAEAKLKIDSVKLCFPKAFEEIKQGIALMDDVRRSENMRNIAYCDSLLIIAEDSFKKLKGSFRYVIDKKYQDEGEYISNLIADVKDDVPALRVKVGERGELYLESVWVGQELKHNKIRADIGNDSYVETNEVTADGFNYRFKTDKNHEIVRFISLGEQANDGGMINIICSYADKPISITFIGKRTGKLVLSSQMKRAVCQSLQLSMKIKEVEMLRDEKKKNELQLKYLNEKNVRSNKLLP